MTIVEAIATLLGLLYIYYAIYQHKLAWLYALLSSAVYGWLFLQSRLYLQSGLQLFFILSSVYGFYYWSRPKPLTVTTLGTIRLAVAVLAACISSWPLASLLSAHSDSSSPHLDALTTMLSVLGTFCEAHKKLEAWYVWIVVNALCVGLFISQSLFATAGVYVLFFLLSFVGLGRWKKDAALSCAR